MLNKIKTYLCGTVIGIIIGVFSTIGFIHFVQPKAEAIKQIVTQTISGAPLVINSIKTKGKTTTMNTSYSGEGQSVISIPNSSIPSANAWDSYHWGIGGMISTNLTYDVLGSYRYQRFMALGSVWYKNKNGYEFGARIGAMYLF